MLDDILKKPSFSNQRLEGQIARVASQFFQDLAKNLSSEEIITVTRTLIARGKYYIRIWVSFSSFTKDKEKDLDNFLIKCEKPFKKYLAEHMKDIRKIPPIKFILDDTSDYVKTINKLLK